MQLSDIVSSVEKYVETHVQAVKDLIELVPRLEQLIADLQAAADTKPPASSSTASEASTTPTPPEATPPAQPPAAAAAMPWTGPGPTPSEP